MTPPRGGQQPCLICAGVSSPAGTRNGHTYLRCRACGLYFVHPRPAWKSLLGWYGPEYYTGGIRDDRGQIVGYENYSQQGPQDAERVFAWLARACPELRGKRVLDVGCARGYLAQLLIRAGAEVEGVEMAPDALSHLSGIGIRIHSCLQDAAVQAGNFDLVVMSEYLEHTLDPMEELRLVHTCLRQKGCLAITVPNGSQLCVHTYGVEYHSFTAPVHLQVFTLESLRRAIRGLFVARRWQAYSLNLQNPLPRLFLRCLGITTDRIHFDGTAEVYACPGSAAKLALRIARAYRYRFRHSDLLLNMGLRAILERS